MVEEPAREVEKRDSVGSMERPVNNPAPTSTGGGFSPWPAIKE
jgi:hypothetical protein